MKPAATLKLSPHDADAISYARSRPVTLALMAARMGVGKMQAAEAVRELIKAGYLKMQDGVITTA